MNISFKTKSGNLWPRNTISYVRRNLTLLVEGDTHSGMQIDLDNLEGTRLTIVTYNGKRIAAGISRIIEDKVRHQLYVRKEWRRREVGTKLLEHMISQYFQHKEQFVITWNVEVHRFLDAASKKISNFNY